MRTPTTNGDRGFLLALIGVALLLGLAYDLLTPPSNYGPDEADHFQYVQTMVESGGAQVSGLQAKQPPIYYWLVAPGYLLTRDQPQQLQYSAIRLFSLALLVGEVLLAYLVAKMLSPTNRFVYLSATAIVALLPGRLWLSAMINNDNLAILASAGLIALFVRCLLRGFDRGSWIALAILVPVALLSKLTAWPVVAIVGLALAAVAMRRYGTSRILGSRAMRVATTVATIVLSGIVFLLVFSWAKEAAGQLPGPGEKQQDLALQLIQGPLAPVDRMSGNRLTYIHGTWQTLVKLPPPQPEPFLVQYKTFWLPLWRDDYAPPDPAFLPGAALGVLTAGGGAFGLLRLLFWRRGPPPDRRKALCLGLFVLVIAAVWLWVLLQFLIFVGGTGSFIPRRYAAWATHARYLFPALVPVAYLMALGLGQFVAAGWRSLGLAAVVGTLLYLNGVALYSLVYRVYWWPS